MAELRLLSGRPALGLAIALLTAVQIGGLVQSLRSHERLRHNLVQGAFQIVRQAQPELRDALQQASPRGVLRRALRATRASEAELFRFSGELVLAQPRRSPAQHWPTDEQLSALRSGDVLSLGPLAGAPSRVLTYVASSGDADGRILRLSSAVPDLVEDLRDRRLLWLGHALSLAVLAIAAVLTLLPSRAAPESPARALEVYEEAMSRLRDRGEALSREHEVERRRLGEEIQLKEAMARAGELAAGMAHEVRNGLATIVGHARLAEKSAGSASAVESAQAILEECQTLEVVVRRLVDYVKRERLELARFDPVRMLSRVAARESRGAPGAQVTPLAPGACEIVGDEELLERAFENLVRNAREAAGVEGHVEILVQEQEQGQAGELHVHIEDDGPGLLEGDEPSFRPFQSTKPGGLGLGLPMALKIIRLHGGELSLVGRVPRGLVALVRLPLGGPPPDAGVTRGSASTAGDAVPSQE